jgi:catechol 2,3-dioxygenase-like lactoylglutathione lyase family enzyme
MLKDFDVVASIPVGDIERAKRWYQDKLGFTPEREHPAGVHYRSGDTSFLLYPTQFAGTGQHTLAGWEVDDLRALIPELRQGGVVFEEYDFPGLKTEDGVADLGSELAAWFKDSEGNILGLFQYRT